MGRGRAPCARNDRWSRSGAESALAARRSRGGARPQAEHGRIQMSIQRISVLGGGAWGTALAQTCARAGRDVLLWEFDRTNAEHLETQRESRFLPGVKLEDQIAITRDLKDAADADAILLVVPAQAMRSVLVALAPALKDGTPLIACAKGIEHGTHKFMTEIVVEHAPNALPAILSGPSFASDVARGLPTAVTIAAADA